MKKRNIEQIFIKAAKKLDNFAKTRRADDDTLYLHWTWHPRCISKPKLRLLYKNILKERSGFKNLIICYSRPKNLRDSLMKTKLNEPEGHRISDLLLQTKLNWIGRRNKSLVNTHYKSQPPQKFLRRYLRSAQRCYANAPWNFSISFFYPDWLLSSFWKEEDTMPNSWKGVVMHACNFL